MAADDGDIQRTLGQLVAEVQSLKASTDKADESRRHVHRRLDAMTADMHGIKADVGAMKADVADSKKVTDEVKRWKLMGMGALAVVGLGGTAMGVLIVGALERLAQMLRVP